MNLQGNNHLLNVNFQKKKLSYQDQYNQHKLKTTAEIIFLFRVCFAQHDN